MAVSSKTWSVGEVVTAANMNTYVRDNLADLQSNKVVIYTGSYSGSTGAAQTVTGVGFTPKYLRIWESKTDGDDIAMWETTAEILDDDVDGMCIRIDMVGGVLLLKNHDNLITALSTGSFTVDGAANTTGISYNFMTFGAE